VAGLVAVNVVLALWYVTARSDHSDASHRTVSEPTEAEAVAGLRDEAPSEGAELIRAENAKPGSPEWLIEDGDRRPRPIEGFTDRVSGQQGDTVRLFVTTEAPTYEVIAYRLGHYGGVGARQIWASGPLTGIEQPDCITHPDTRMVDCSNWSTSLSVEVDEEWTPGQYLFKLILPDDSDSFVPFVVRDDERHSDVLIVSGVTTLQAYNTWGGYSLYTATGGRPGGRATVVSFDRPMDMYWGQSGILGDTYNVGMLAESLGLDVTYTTNIDQHQRPELMRNHRVIVSGFHDEYYSVEMREGLEAARDEGTNVVFLGANAVYRRIRLEDSPVGPSRHQVNHRSAEADPLDGVDPELVTSSWRDPPAARPESSLTGTLYECNEPGLKADMVIVDGDAWIFEGTGVATGQRWPGVVQEEYDRVMPEMPTPANIQVLSRSPLTCRGQASYSDMTYYTMPNAGGVLSVGTLGFEGRVGPVCNPEDVGPGNWECQLRQMVANVLTELAKGPAGLTHPSRPNLEEIEP
jgi:hypothetical protein